MRHVLILAVMTAVAATADAQQTPISGWRIAGSAGLEAAGTWTTGRNDSSFVTTGPTISLRGDRHMGSRFILRPTAIASFDVADDGMCFASLPPQSCRFSAHAFNAVIAAATRFWIVEPEIGFGWGALYRSAVPDRGMVANGLTGNAAITLVSSPANRRRVFVQLRHAHWAESGKDRRRSGLSAGLDWR
jgi:hypothetical protein